ncbi:hypothetical protein BKI52_31610 [marine bacterium AO1-C]|nr:hypothetical protein BKI52_31610 [marine bacterium AO1-C]
MKIKKFYVVLAVLLVSTSWVMAKTSSNNDTTLTTQNKRSGEQFLFQLKMQDILNQKFDLTSQKKRKGWRDGVTFLEIGGGAAVVYRSNDRNFQNARLPLHFFAEFGNTGVPLSFVLSYNANVRFNADSLSINPRHINLSLKYSLLRYAYFIPEWIDAYAFMGVGLWTNNIVRRPDPGAPATAERSLPGESGFSFTAGLGTSFRIIDRFALNVQLAYYNGGSDIPVVTNNPNPNPPPPTLIFPRRIDAGSLQVQLLLSYRFGFSGGHKYVCPTFL